MINLLGYIQPSIHVVHGRIWVCSNFAMYTIHGFDVWTGWGAEDHCGNLRELGRRRDREHRGRLKRGEDCAGAAQVDVTELHGTQLGHFFAHTALHSLSLPDVSCERSNKKQRK